MSDIEAVSYVVTYRGLDEGEAMVTASVEGEVIGALRWNFYEDPPVVVDLSVDERYQRQGIGTRLFEEAKRSESRLVHSDVLTEDGRGFRDALGAVVAAEDHDTDVMICLRPSEALRKVYADMDECTEPLEDLHITLYYLGEIEEDCGGEMGRERLYRGLYDFVLHAGYRGLTGRINGFGQFLNEDANSLIALWDIPGIAEFRTSIMMYCKTHGFFPRQDDHGFTPHMSLAHSEEPFEKFPRLPAGNPEKEIFTSIWLVWGEEWQEIPLL